MSGDEPPARGAPLFAPTEPPPVIARDMPASVVERIAKLAKDLPALPAVAQKAMALLGDPSTEPEELQGVLSRDAALALKVLRLANSAYYRRGREITTLSAAVVVLGFKTIHTCVLSSAVHRVISAAGSVADRLWEHSFAAGAACRELARVARLSVVEREEAFLCGLFHDVGKGVIAAKFPGVYAEPLGLAGEVEQLGFHHGHLGHVLLSRWEIPETLRLAVAGHHDPDTDGLGRLTVGGDWLAWQVASGVGAEPPPEPAALLAELELGPEQREELRETVRGFLAEEKSQA